MLRRDQYRASFSVFIGSKEFGGGGVELSFVVHYEGGSMTQDTLITGIIYYCETLSLDWAEDTQEQEKVLWQGLESLYRGKMTRQESLDLMDDNLQAIRQAMYGAE